MCIEEKKLSPSTKTLTSSICVSWEFLFIIQALREGFEQGACTEAYIKMDNKPTCQNIHTSHVYSTEAKHPTPGPVNASWRDCQFWSCCMYHSVKHDDTDRLAKNLGIPVKTFLAIRRVANRFRFSIYNLNKRCTFAHGCGYNWNKEIIGSN